MEKSYETMAVFVCEQTTEPQQVKYEYVKNPSVEFLRFRACLQGYDEWNRNNRWYGLKPMRKSWGAKHIAEMESTGTFFGEYGHPDENSGVKRIVTIDPKYACHRICSHEFQGSKVYGVIETLNDGANGWGTVLMRRILQGAKAAFSIRALVPLTKVDAVRCKILQPGHIVTADSVILPSHTCAYEEDGPVTYTTTAKTTAVGESTQFSLTSFGLGRNPIGNSFTDYSIAAESTGAEFVQYLSDKSINVKGIIENFEINPKNIKYNTDNNTFVISEAANPANGFRKTTIVKADKYISAEVSKIMAKLY